VLKEVREPQGLMEVAPCTWSYSRPTSAPFGRPMSTVATGRPSVPHEPVAVVGAGLMGHAIAELFAAGGHPVALYDSAPAALATVMERIEAAARAKGDDLAELASISVHEELEPAVKDAQLVVEAVAESLEVKRKLFATLDRLTDRATTLATNTSALPVSAIAEATQHPERVVGTHFWNPPHLVPLVEVVQGEKTAQSTVECTIEMLERIGKSPVHVRRDIPGFIGNRLQHALKREAIALVADGVCDAETVDRVVREGFGSRMAVLGPMEQSDLVGLDLTLAIHETLMPSLDRSDQPHPLLVSLVASGKTGMAAGEGFRRWTPEEADEVRRRLNKLLAQGAHQDSTGNEKTRNLR